MTNGENGEGYRITLGVVYTKLEAVAQKQSDMVADFRVMALALENERKQRADDAKERADHDLAQKTRIEKLENKLNGMFLTLGSGAAVGVLLYLEGLIR